MRVLLDTGVLVRANAKSRGPARVALDAILRGPHQLIISEFILDETARVLRYPRLLARHGLSEQEIEEHVDFLRRTSELVDVRIGAPVVLSDPDDDAVIYTAFDGQADVLCTLDRHFFDPHVLKFCSTRNIAVMTDVDFLQLLVPKPPRRR